MTARGDGPVLIRDQGGACSIAADYLTAGLLAAVVAVAVTTGWIAGTIHAHLRSTR